MNFTLKNIKNLVPLAFFFLPLLASAAGLLPNCGQSGGLNGVNYLIATSCNLCNFGQLIQNVINFLIMISIPISVALFAWAGILYFTSAGDTHKVDQAHKIFKSVFIGFVIAISGWLVVQVLLSALVNKNFYPGGHWNNLQCADNNQRPRNTSLSQVLSSNPDPNATVSPAASGGTGGGGGPLTGPVTDMSSAVQAICQVESGCGQNVDNGNGTGCNGVGACGPMQIKPATACSTNSSFSSGCNSDGSVNNQTQVAADLQNLTSSKLLAGQVLTQAQNSSACNGNLDCAIAVYSGDPTATQPSACCVSGAAYQCPYDCGSTVPRSVACDQAGAPASCVAAASCTTSSGQCTAYGYLQLVKKAGK